MEKKLLDYVKWTLQTEKVDHKSLMSHINHVGSERGKDAAFLIAQRAIDLALEASPTNTL